MGINSRIGKSNPKLPPAAAGAAAHNAKVAVTLFLCSPWLLASAGHRRARIPAGEPRYICLRERASRELTSAEAFTRRVGRRIRKQDGIPCPKPPHIPARPPRRASCSTPMLFRIQAGKRRVTSHPPPRIPKRVPKKIRYATRVACQDTLLRSPFPILLRLGLGAGRARRSIAWRLGLLAVIFYQHRR